MIGSIFLEGSSSYTLEKNWWGTEPKTIFWTGKKVSYIVRDLKGFRIRFNSRNHFGFGTDH